MTWIRVRDGFVNSDHIVRIVEDIRDGIDTASILHLVDGTKAIADIDAYDLVEKMQGGNSCQCEPASVTDDDDDHIPF